VNPVITYNCRALLGGLQGRVRRGAGQAKGLPMPWRKPLPKPITLTDGRILETLLDAQRSNSHRGREQRSWGAARLGIAARSLGDRRPADIQFAANRLVIVLSQRKLLP
jgi:hypothetical protein